MTITSPHLGSPSSDWTDARLLYALEEVVEKELNRHLKVAKDWMPHEYVPWSDGRNFPGFFEDGEAWDKEQSKVTEVGRIALVVNLLTEDNLPSYHHEIASLFGRDGAWGTWVHRWTAEEGRHGIVMRDYLLASRAVDPDKLEAVPHGAHERGLRVGQPALDAALGRVRRLPGARDPRLAPQHRPPVRRPGLRPHAGAHRDRREPAHGLLPQPAEGRRSSSPPT